MRRGCNCKRKDWQLWSPEGEDENALRPAQYPACDYILASLDTAYTENTMNDPERAYHLGRFLGRKWRATSRSTPRTACAYMARRRPG